jgi:hypothetical protein
MVFNATFNNISVISWRSALLVDEYPEKTPTCRKSPSNLITYCCIQYSSPERELTMLVVIGTDCMDSKYNYHAINTTTVSHLLGKHNILRYLLYFGGKYNISRAAWDTGRLWSLCANLAPLTAFRPVIQLKS